MRGRYLALAALSLAAGLTAGIGWERQRLSGSGSGEDTGPRVLYWVAPMDPNFRKDGPGKSPMGMDLVPVYEGDEPSADAEEIRLSAAEINAIGVRTALAHVEQVAQRVETVGFVTYDEHLTSHIHMRVEGWVERLAVRAIGDPVSEGDLLFELYAPEITIASSELLRATRRNDRREIEVARRQLRNFGVTPQEIERMATADAPAQRFSVFAPQDGVVIALEGADGMYLTPDTRAMSLADLSSVWVMVDVFERDIGRLEPDMRAEARFEHLPGQIFAGEVDYIFPELDPQTRTLRVRLRFDNARRLLRPNMFATVSLVPRETRDALTVPSEAVIRTGRAERVILKTGNGVFRPRLVTTGLRGGFGSGGRTEIVQGLSPGDEVVASAQFLIDSESALNAGLLRFAPTEGEPAVGSGVLVSLDRSRREAVIRHEEIPSLDWPALETRFAVRSDVPLDRLFEGDAVRFTAFRGADGLLALSDVRPDDGIDATGTGVVHGVTKTGRLTLSHDPIPSLGWPSMRMDMPVQGLDAAAVPLETPVEFDLAKGADGLYTIVGVRTPGATSAEAGTAQNVAQETPEGPPPMTVAGTINTVDPETRMANVTHGPMAEIGMPGMTMDFPLASDLDPDALPLGTERTLLIEQGADFSLTLVGVEDAP